MAVSGSSSLTVPEPNEDTIIELNMLIFGFAFACIIISSEYLVANSGSGIISLTISYTEVIAHYLPVLQC